MKQVAYYKGCLASLSAKELDISTKALAPKVGYELHRARVGHVLRRRRHPRGGARLLPAPERADPRLRRGDGVRHLMTVCNVCTLNLRQANYQLQIDETLRERVNDNLERSACRATGARSRCKHFSGWSPGDAFRQLQAAAHKGLQGLKIAPFYGCQILRPSKLMGFEDPDKPELAGADHRGLRRRGDRLSGQDQVLRIPDHPGTRGHGPRAS